MKNENIVRIVSSESCPTNSKIIQTAVKKLEDEGYAQGISINDLNSTVGKSPLLVIDGDDRNEASSVLSAYRIKADFHLVVTVLGIETREEYTEDDLELLIDGIKAACTVTDGPTPHFNCTCCGSL